MKIRMGVGQLEQDIRLPGRVLPEFALADIMDKNNQLSTVDRAILTEISIS